MSTKDIVILGSIGVFVAAILLSTFQFWHIVNEGHCGFYYRFGRLQDSQTFPGLHFRLPPPITTAIEVYVKPQVDSVKNVMCGSKDGSQIIFPSIEVGNTLPTKHAHNVIKEYGEQYDQFLVFKQVQYIANALCSEYSSHEIVIEKFNIFDDLLKAELETIQKDLKTGLLIDFVRMAKPSLPKALDKAYQQQAAERALKKAKVEEFLRIQQENLNDQEKAKGLAQVKLVESERQNEMIISKKKAQQTESQIENEMIRETAKAESDAIKAKASANQLLLTKEYLELKKYEALLSNSKLIFSNDMQNNMLLTSINDILKEDNAKN